MERKKERGGRGREKERGGIEREKEGEKGRKKEKREEEGGRKQDTCETSQSCNVCRGTICSHAESHAIGHRRGK